MLGVVVVVVLVKDGREGGVGDGRGEGSGHLVRARGAGCILAGGVGGAARGDGEVDALLNALRAGLWGVLGEGGEGAGIGQGRGAGVLFGGGDVCAGGDFERVVREEDLGEAEDGFDIGERLGDGLLVFVVAFGLGGGDAVGDWGEELSAGGSAADGGGDHGCGLEALYAGCTSQGGLGRSVYESGVDGGRRDL